MQLLATKIVKRMDLGSNGNLFGGQLLAWVDEAVAAYAMLILQNREMVTLSIDSLKFEREVKEGALLQINAGIIKTGNTSATFAVVVNIYDPVNASIERVFKTNMTFVRVINGKSTPISKQSIDS
jgi:acyl-CoA thioesterase YciA